MSNICPIWSDNTGRNGTFFVHCYALYLDLVWRQLIHKNNSIVLLANSSHTLPSFTLIVGSGWWCCCGPKKNWFFTEDTCGMLCCVGILKQSNCSSFPHHSFLSDSNEEIKTCGKRITNIAIVCERMCHEIFRTTLTPKMFPYQTLMMRDKSILFECPRKEEIKIISPYKLVLSAGLRRA